MRIMTKVHHLQRIDRSYGRLQTEPESNLRQTLEELPEDSKFDQFRGRTTDFSMDLYSVKMPGKVAPEVQAHADQVERDIMGKRHMIEEDEAILQVDDGRNMRRERRTEEQLFGTALPDGMRADEENFARNQQANDHQVQPAKKPATLKDLLALSLAAEPDAEEPEQMQIMVVPVNDAASMRSRGNSLRDGQPSKVIENLDIDQPKLDKEQIEEYLRFKALKNLQTGVPPRDRKLSQEYFKEEAKRLNKKLQEGCHLGKP